MRDYTKVSNSVWKSKKFRSLKNTDDRLAYLYLLTGPHANSAGCYDLPIPYACADLEWEEKRYRDSLERLCNVGLIRFDAPENTVLVTKWFDHCEPMNPKHALSILTALDQASSEALKAEALEAVKPAIIAKKCQNDKDVGHKIKSIVDRIQYGISTGTLTVTGTETGTGTKPNLDLNETRESSRTALAPPPPERAALAPSGETPDLPEFLDRNHPLNTAFLKAAS